MKETDKLRVLIPHWIEHNIEHADEFRDWAERAGDAAKDIREAADRIKLANQALFSALERLGGSLPHPFLNKEMDKE
ncbi:MAG: hypothetical protein ABFS03_11155 [Chloroflexota bacterium]